MLALVWNETLQDNSSLETGLGSLRLNAFPFRLDSIIVSSEVLLMPVVLLWKVMHDN